MASTKVIQRSFAGGEISPQMFGRIDDSKYATGLETCLNFLCLPQGPIQNRPGFAYVAKVKDSTKPTRLIPFTFNYTQTMVIELGDKYARFHTQGATLLNNEGNPYEIVTPWAAEDVFDIHYVQSADVMTLVHPAYPPQELRRYSVLDWRIVPVVTGWKIDPPTNVKAKRETEAADDKNSEKYKFRYMVSCLNADKTQESQAVEAYYENSDTSVQDGVIANLYQYGTTVKIYCDEMPGAAFYRFYKCQGGLFGYIGDSEEPWIIDGDIDPKMDVTPRRYDDPFQEAKGISSATVVNGGSGYADNSLAPLTNASITKSTFLFTDTYKQGYTSSDYRNDKAPNWLFNYPNRETASAAMKQVIDGGYPCISSSSNYRIYEWAVMPNESPTERGAGSGATIAYDTVTENGFTGYYNFRVTSGGSGYTESPIFRLRYRDRDTNYKSHWYLRAAFRLYTQEKAEIVVTDSTGHGAELVPVVRDGVITEVKIRSGGTNYTSPTASVVSTSGSGAQITLQVGGSGNYPAAVGYYEQRRAFAGLAQNPQRVIMSCSGTEDDFTYSLPVRDSDRIDATVAVTQFDGIRHIVPLAQMMLMTSGSEIRVAPMNSDALTPDSFSALPQSAVGSSNVQPHIINNNIIYCASRGGHVREFAYQYNAGGYVSGDLCLRSAHLFDFKEIRDMTYAKAPYPVVWFVSSSGDLLGLTYVPEQSVGSWHRHTTEGEFESCACVSEDGEDRLYVVVRRTINGEVVRYVERLASRNFQGLENAFFVDCGGTYNGDPANEISGLDWLEGQTVSILADGAVMPQQVVHEGKITLEEPASVVHVGLPYTSDCKTLPVVLQEASFGIGMQKNVSRMTIRVYQSSGILAGPSFSEDDLVEYKQRTTETPGSPASEVTGEVSMMLFPTWSDGGAVCIRQADPLPLSLLSMSLELSV